MATATLKSNILQLLAKNTLRQELARQLMTLKDRSGDLSRSQVSVVLGQWFHPLHYFPVFLSRLISVCPSIEMQTHISRILWQELGEGNPDRAHEKIYIETMRDAGFSPDLVGSASALTTTSSLVDGYQKASSAFLSGLGFLYGTEVADLGMVSTIGDLVRRSSGRRDLPWVDIHVRQEPDHVESSSHALLLPFETEQEGDVVEGAELMWSLWIDFFAGIERQLS